MARRRHENMANDDGVQDSFLDIVANIVGILILLVIVVGVRAAMQAGRETESESSNHSPLVTIAMVDNEARALASSQQQLAELHTTTLRLAAEAHHRDAERLEMATYITAVEQQLNAEKTKLSFQDARRLELRSELTAADFEWQDLMRQRIALETEPRETEQIVHTPTPIVRTSSPRTIHLRLKRGLVATVPFEKLLDVLETRPIEARRRDLQRQGGVGRIGPVGGFELLYAHIARASAAGPGGMRQLVTFLAGEIHPVNDHLGESIEEALDPNSSLSAALAATTPRQTIVMVWAYPDSSKEFRELQAAVRKRGFSVDLRLLAEGTHISFSPEGRKTAAQ